MLDDSIFFKSFGNEHFEILHAWLQKDHVKAFWDDGDRTIEQVKSHYDKEPGVNRYIFTINNHPAGYLQTYEINQESEFGAYTLLDRKNIGIDFLISDEEFLNKGFALKVLSTFISLHCKDIDRIIVDPQPSNHKAILIYKKYGFQKLAEHTIEGKEYEILLMDI